MQTHITGSPAAKIPLNVFTLLWMTALRRYYEFMCLQGRDVCKWTNYVCVECIYMEG